MGRKRRPANVGPTKGPGFRQVYTTGHVSKICQVAPRTVAKWCDGGLLPHYRIPLSDDRRIRHADLVAFLRSHGMDSECEQLLRCESHLLLVGVDTVTSQRLAEFGDCRIFSASDAFDVGLRMAAGVEPRGAVIAWGAVGEYAARGIARRLREREVAPLIALVGDDGAGEQEAADAGYTLVQRPPYNATAILEACDIALREGVVS